MPCQLFYGPGAQKSALEKAATLGRMVHPPLGGDGLKTEEARKVVSLLSSTAVGDMQGVLIIGPLDGANLKACDVLLKTLEEYQEGDVLPILWAEDLAEVPATIRSRCLAQWSWGDGEVLPPELLALSWQIVEGALEGDVMAVVNSFQDAKVELRDLGRCLARCIAERAQSGGKETLILWDRLRPELRHPQLSPVGFLQAFLRVAVEGVDG